MSRNALRWWDERVWLVAGSSSPVTAGQPLPGRRLSTSIACGTMSPCERDPGNGPRLMIREKEDPVVADPPTENPFPFLALQSLHIALEGIGFHLREYPRNALL